MSYTKIRVLRGGRIKIFLRAVLVFFLPICAWMLTGCAGKTEEADDPVQETVTPSTEAMPESLLMQTVVSEILEKEPEDIEPGDLSRITGLEFSEKEDAEINSLCEIRFSLDGNAPVAEEFWAEVDRTSFEGWWEANPSRIDGSIEIAYDDFGKDGKELSDLAVFSSLKTLKLNMRLSGEKTDLSLLKDLRILSSDSYSAGELGKMFSDTPKITHLTLDGPDSVEGIAYFENLEYLALESCRADRLEEVGQLTKLVSFRLSSISWRPVKGLEALSEMDCIENICLEEVEGTDFSFLKDMKQLKKLSLKNLPHTDLSFLEGLNGLEQLKISDCRELQDISAVSDLIGLTEFRFTQNADMELPDLALLTNMRRLDMSLSVPFDLNKLASMTDLEYLCVYSYEIYNPGCLQNMPKLKKLFLNNLYGDEEISDLFNLQSLELLDLGNGIFRLDTDNIVPNETMKHLYLSRSVINGGQTDFSFLVNYPNLINLNLRGQSISSLEFLDSLAGLEGFCVDSAVWETLGEGKDREGLELVIFP